MRLGEYVFMTFAAGGVQMTWDWMDCQKYSLTKKRRRDCYQISTCVLLAIARYKGKGCGT